MVYHISARRFGLFVAVAAVLSFAVWVRMHSSRPTPRIELPPLQQKPSPNLPPHPIDDLIRSGEEELQRLLHTETNDVRSAAAAYRARRGRQPPPGFDAWYEFAKNHGGVMIEAFFDQIHHDLNPFWGVEPSTIRRQAKTLGKIAVIVRNGTASFRTDEPRPRVTYWHEMATSIQQHLPDVDLPLNVMDESRVTVPWEKINEYIKGEVSSRKVQNTTAVTSSYTGLAALDRESNEPFEPQWEGRGPFWKIASRGCAPDTPAHTASVFTDFSGSPSLPRPQPGFMEHGFVKNWTQAKDPCIQPELQALHGTFIEPISISSTDQLIPLFGGSKLPMNNEILIPPAFYWAKDELYSGGDYHGGDWNKKKNKVIWRGVASGGRNHKDNWTHFHRHRFLSMINGTSVRLAEQAVNTTRSFALPPFDDYPHLKSRREGSLGAWLDHSVDAGFTNLWCFPSPADGDKGCPYTNDYYALQPGMPMKEQYAFKYLPDIDGNSYSGRYRAFLYSSSLPIKATIYSEWHDSRLLPWVHFVPMDNTFVDFYAIMDYFLGDDPDDPDAPGSRDEVARRIAKRGQAWAEKVLRREDMQIYLYRLILEFARLCDDQRQSLGYVGDLVGDS